MEIRRQEQVSVRPRDSASLLAAEKHKEKIKHRSTLSRALSWKTEKLQFALSLLISWLLLKMTTLHLYLSALSFSSAQT